MPGNKYAAGSSTQRGSDFCYCCLTLCDPTDYVARQAPLSMGFPRQKYWSELSFPSPGNLPDPGIEPGSPVLQADSLLSDPPEKPRICSESQYSTASQIMCVCRGREG